MDNQHYFPVKKTTISASVDVLIADFAPNAKPAVDATVYVQLVNKSL